MKRLILIIALVVLTAVTSSSFAATHTIASTSIGVTALTSDFAAVTAENLTELAPTVFGKHTNTWSSGTLFTVTPDDSYSGDLVVEVYLVNTGELIRYYEHLNMSIQFIDTNSVVADEQGETKVLNLQNSEIIFTWANGTGTSPYRVQLTGGGYRLHPWKSITGGSISPQLWVDIKQR